MSRSTPGCRSFLLALSLALLALTACRSADWGYHDPIGPDDWAFLSPDYRECCQGKRQSPVDIVDARQAALPPLQLTYGTVPRLTAEYNGHTIEAEIPEGLGSLQVGTESLRLTGFHFHRRSEHRLGGRDFPMEMHLVHTNGRDRAVVGVFLVEGPANPELSRIWLNLPKPGKPTTTVPDFKLAALVPAELGSYRYPGSLTTPACDENVRWIVLAAPLTMTVKQIQDFEKVFSGKEFPDGNRRPAQALGNRVVETDVQAPSVTPPR